MLARIIIFCVLLLIDCYVFQAVKSVCKNSSEKTKKSIYRIFGSVTIFISLVLLFTFILDYHSWNKAFREYVFAFIVIIYFSKIFVLPFLIIDDIIRFFRWMISFIRTKRNISEIPIKRSHTISRSRFLSYAGITIAAIPFASFICGMMGNAYNYKVKNVKLRFPKLPSSFNDLRIMQISDIHIGSFMSMEPVKKAVQLIKEQKCDIIFFTGDLVNERTVEVTDFVEALKEIQAPMGVYSIFGNHDYGDYYEWQNKEAKKENLEQLKNVHRDLGWRLLLNENTTIEKNGEKINLIGVENWSAHNRFKKYGDLKKATSGMQDAPFKILLSHDPSHWSAEVTEKYSDIDLTFSGHTHGMQFGVRIPNFQWSPVQYLYKHWLGLYQHKDQYLYVNPGLGFIGYPGRVGIMPEITMFELQS